MNGWGVSSDGVKVRKGRGFRDKKREIQTKTETDDEV